MNHNELAAAAAGSHHGSQRPRPILPDPPKFEGKRSLYRPWLLEMQHKLQTDKLALGSDRDRFNYIYSRLGPTPQRTCATFVQAYSHNGKPEEFLEHLGRYYSDPDLQRRATEELRSLKQKPTQPFHQFLPIFEQKLADAGGAAWPPTAVISYLNGSLNRRTQLALVSCVGLPTTWDEYVSVIYSISSRLESVTAEFPGKERPSRPANRAWVDEMDWEPTTRVASGASRSRPAGGSQQKPEDAALRGKRAKWVDDEEIAKRRKEGRCFRCGRTYCRVDRCPLEPPRRPGNSGRTRVNRANVVTAAAIEDEDPTSGEDSDSEEKSQGNE